MWPFKNYWILGLNARNLDYIWKYNDKLAKRLRDSKIKTKEFLWNKWVNVARELAIIKDHKALENFDLDSLPLPFVIKPNKWYAGKWIIVFESKDEKWNLISLDGKSYSKKELKDHISDALDGFFSLSWSRDKVIFERKLILDRTIELLWKYGLPDVRVIVFNNIPVVAMMRVPTPESKWKANLALWACGLGIDIWSGRITYMTHHNKEVKSIPGIWDVRGIEIPKWDKILNLAVQVQLITKIGYIGCDIVLDDEVWPVLLEMNARPGLGLQVVNKVPLLARLKKAENIKITSASKWVRVARDLFGWDIEEKIRSISGKKVIWNKEYIEISYGKEVKKVIWEIKTTKESNYIDENFLKNELKFPIEKHKNKLVPLKISILWEDKIIKFFPKELKDSSIILWKSSLEGFLVDPFKYNKNDLPIDTKNPMLKERNIVILTWYKEQLLKIDEDIHIIDRRLNLLKILTPKNTTSEKLKFIESKWSYKLNLKYNEIKIDIDESLEIIKKISIPDIPLSSIYLRKKEEVINKLKFLKAFQTQDIENMSKYIWNVYGHIEQKTLEYANNILKTSELEQKENRFLTFDEIKKELDRFNFIYGINLKITQKESWSRFSLKWDSLNVRSTVKIWKKELRPIVAHEIETHYLRRINGRNSEFKIFTRWTAKYIEIEEWLAIYNQNIFLNKTSPKYYVSSRTYRLLDFALNNSYEDFINELIKEYDYNYNKACNFLIRHKRWITDVSKNYIFTKDVVYLNWLLKIQDFIDKWWSISKLYFWKIWIDDLEDIKKSNLININIDNLTLPLFI